MVYYLFVCFCFVFGCSCSMQKFQGQGLNLHHTGTQDIAVSTVGFLTLCATQELPIWSFVIGFFQLIYYFRSSSFLWWYPLCAYTTFVYPFIHSSVDFFFFPPAGYHEQCFYKCSCTASYVDIYLLLGMKLLELSYDKSMFYHFRNCQTGFQSGIIILNSYQQYVCVLTLQLISNILYYLAFKFYLLVSVYVPDRWLIYLTDEW